MAKMRISPELKKLIEKYRCVKDTEGMSPAKVQLRIQSKILFQQ